MKKLLWIIPCLLLSIIGYPQTKESQQSLLSARKPKVPDEMATPGYNLDIPRQYMLKEHVSANNQIVRYFSIDKENKKDKKNVAKQLHQVTFQFDQQPMVGSVQAFNNSNVYYEPILFGSPVIEMEEGVYEVICDGIFMGNPKYVFLSEISIHSDTTIKVNYSKAIHEIKLEPLDKDNQIMLYGDPNIINESVTVTIEFPQHISISKFMQLSSGKLYFSDIDPSYNLNFSITGLKQGELYIIDDLEDLTGITNDVTLTSNPAEYTQYISYFKESPVSNDNYVILRDGIITNIEGSYQYSYVSLVNLDYPINNQDTIDVYISNVLSPSKPLTITAAIEYWEENPLSYPGGRAPLVTFTKPAYLTSEGDIAFCEGNLLPADYQMPAGNMVMYSITSPIITSYNYNNSKDMVIALVPGFVGQVNELRYIDFYSAIYKIKKGSEILVNDSIYKFYQPYQVTDQGEYTLSIENDNYFLNGLRGLVHQDMVFNMGSNDANSPVITSFKAVHKDNLIDTLFYSEDQLFINFTAGDWNWTDSLFYSLADAKLYYKEHSSENWTEQSIQEISQNFDSRKYGTYYECDLSSLFSQYADLLYFDIKIQLTDLAGNYTTQTISPAFLIEGIGTVDVQEFDKENNNIRFHIYPNPVKDYGTVSFTLSQRSHVELSVYNINGQLINIICSKEMTKGEHEIRWPVTNSSEERLCPGIYFLRLDAGNEVETRKVIVH